MSKPDIIPKVTVSGITVDPRTLDRVIPESRRPDGTYVGVIHCGGMLNLWFMTSLSGRRFRRKIGRSVFAKR